MNGGHFQRLALEPIFPTGGKNSFLIATSSVTTNKTVFCTLWVMFELDAGDNDTHLYLRGNFSECSRF